MYTIAKFKVSIFMRLFNSQLGKLISLLLKARPSGYITVIKIPIVYLSLVSPHSSDSFFFLQEFEKLCDILRPMTTGSSQADMLVSSNCCSMHYSLRFYAICLLNAER